MKRQFVAAALTSSLVLGNAQAVTFSSSAVSYSADMLTVTFSLQLTGSPDFWTTSGNEADAFAVWTDATRPYALKTADAANAGHIPLGEQAVLQSQTINEVNTIDVAWLGVGPGTSLGGWGTTVGQATYQISVENLLSVSLPTALLRDADGVFYYSVMWTNYGSMVEVADYVSTRSEPLPAVPEPATSLMSLAGLAGLVVAVRRKRKATAVAPLALVRSRPGG